MIQEKSSISTFQLYCILFCSRMVGSFTFMLHLQGDVQTGDRPFILFFYLLFSLLFAIPVFAALGKDRNAGLLRKAAVVSPVFSKGLAIAYCAEFLWVAAVTTARFGLFTGTVMFQQTNVLLYIAVLLIASVFCAVKGLEPLVRAGVVFLVLLVLSILFIILTLLEKFEWLNITRPFYGGVPPVLHEAFLSSCRNFELVSLLLVAPRVSGKLGRGYLRWIVLLSVLLGLIFTVVGGVTGYYGDNQMFPLYTLTVLAKFSIFERMDDLLTGLWVVCALLKITYFIYVALFALEEGFGKKLKIGWYIGAGGIVFAGYCVLASSITLFTAVLRSPVNSILFLVFCVVLPVAVGIACAIRRKRQKQKEESTV